MFSGTFRSVLLMVEAAPTVVSGLSRPRCRSSEFALLLRPFDDPQGDIYQRNVFVAIFMKPAGYQCFEVI